MLQLADRSSVQPDGKIEDILVRVDKFIFPADFLVLDCEADDNAPIILGRSFLATGRTLIDVEKGELTMRVNDQQVKLNAFHNLKRYDDAEECKAIHTVDTKISCLGSLLGRLFGKKIKFKMYGHTAKGSGPQPIYNPGQQERIILGDAFACTLPVT